MDLPPLPSLHTKPSWVNRAGRVDRSACVELRASEIKRLLEMNFRRRGQWLGLGWGAVAGETRDTAGLEGSATCTIHAEFLEKLHASRLPRALVGDYRTGKANVMKSRFVHPHKVSQPDAPNPNKGASQQKVIHLPPADGEQLWSQTLTLQRWRLHEKLAQHFLVCPRCQQRTMKLFLILCTPDEAADAAYVAIYLRHLQINERNHPGSALESQLVSRYAALFPPRQFQCARCLGLRYGEATR